MARRNTYREDEVLETPFDFHHLLRASVYIKKYMGSTNWILLLKEEKTQSGKKNEGRVAMAELG